MINMNKNSIIVDLNRKRAGISYINIKDYLNNIEEKFKNNENKLKDSRNKMKSYCRRLPVLIRTNGLLNALCFIKGKIKDDGSKSEYSYLYNWINSWFNEIDYCDRQDIVDQILSLSNSEYYIYTKEAIEIANWYKINAEAMIKDGSGDEEVQS